MKDRAIACLDASPRTGRSLYRAVVRLIPLLVLLLAFLLYTLPWLARGTDNLRLLSSLSSDERYVVDIVKCMLTRGVVAVGLCAPYLPDWPRLYFYLCLGAIYPAQAVFSATPTTLAITCRAMTLLLGLLSVAATYLLALRMFNRRLAVLAAALLLSSVVFLRWSVTIHPDRSEEHTSELQSHRHR
jgi:asparagine N-glycosylation enzyme membrane subunit Stt3